tara:strand:- start:18 stop:599 length:582 start_codon:yes stop_codon:yes gene_type:complete
MQGVVISICIVIFSLIVYLILRYKSKREREKEWKFIHITKNGGTGFCLSLQKSKLSKLCCSDLNIACADGSHHTKLRDYIKPYNFIAIVRNPYSRFVSAFSHSKYLTKNSRYYGKNEYKRFVKFDKYRDVNDFVDYLTRGDLSTLNVFHNHSHFHTQTDFLREKNSNEFSKKVKIIMQLETISDDMKKQIMRW